MTSPWLTLYCLPPVLIIAYIELITCLNYSLATVGGEYSLLNTHNKRLKHFTTTVRTCQVVFMSYVLGQMKATLVVAKNTEGRYYEVSYSYLNQRLFVDIYKQISSVVVDIGE